MDKTIQNAGALLLGLLLLASPAMGFAQGTAFSYQGRLASGGLAASGSYDLQFTLYATNVTGTLVAGPVTNLAVGVTNGLFTTLVDFGPGVFTGASNWLQMAVSTNHANNFTTLSPRQQLTPVPYALTTANLSGVVAAAQISGPLAVAQLPGGVVTNGASSVSLTGSFAGNASGLTNIPLTAIGLAGTFNQPGFLPPVAYPVGRYPVGVAAADFNGDGKVDLVSQNADAYNLTVLTNNGYGAFGSNATLSVGTYSTCVIAADLNGDGKPDIISLSINGPLLVFTNNGSGGFGSGVTYAPGSQPTWVTAADIYNNGRPALVTSVSGNNTLFVLTNNGYGVFGSNATLTVGGSPMYVVAADVNGDGKVDLVSANGNDGTLTILTNNGFGVFGSNATVTVGSYPDALAAADVNGDGKVDLVSANGSDGTLTILTNNGYGIFGANATLKVGSFPNAIVATNLNGGGSVDLICANSGDGTLTVLMNTGGGIFVSNATLNLGGNNDVVAADVNGDGLPDLIVASAANNALEVILNLRTISAGGAWSFTNALNSFAGNGSGLTGLNASQLTSGTVPLAQLPAAVVTNTETGVTLGGTFNGSGSGLTNLSAAQLTGVLPASVLPGFNGADNAVGGGTGNTIVNGYQATIAGGQNNTINGTNGAGNFNYQPTIGGGYGNTVSAYYATIAGGENNLANGYWAVIGGGRNNDIASSASAAAIGGGANNTNTGNFATIPGGSQNLAGGQYSLAAGQQAQALHAGAFVWADSQNAPFASTSSNQFLIRAGGNVGLNTTTPESALTIVQTNAGGRGAELSLVNPAASTIGNEVAINFGIDPSTYNADNPNAQIKTRLMNAASNAADLIFSTWNGFTFGERFRIQSGGNLGIGNTNPTSLLVVGNATSPAYCNGTTWVNGSDRNAKQDFTRINPDEVLARVTALPITEWQYKADADGIKHIGPMAQDFHAAFGLNGADDKHISTVDEGGVALAAIQGLNEKLEAQRAENAQIKAENAELKAQLSELKTLVNQLTPLLKK